MKYNLKRIFIISGEKSGDIIADGIIKKIKEQFPNCEIRGIGDESFSLNGLKSIFDQKEISIMGLFEILPKLWKILKLIKLTTEEIIKFNPEHIITIDSPGFNFTIVKKIKNKIKKTHLKCKIHHIVAPSVWAYKKSRAQKIAKLYDTLFCILPFETQYFTPFGLNAIFVGYPPAKRMEEIKKNILHNTKEDIANKQISITLGSRISEVQRHLPILKNTIAILNAKFSNLEFKILTLPHLVNLIDKEFSPFVNVQIISSDEEKWKAVAKSYFVLAKSGTNVMEFAILGTPSIVFYKASFVTEAIFTLLAYTKFVTLLNFTANKYIFPEFLRSNVKSELIAKQVEIWLENPNLVHYIITEMTMELKKFESKNNLEQVIVNEICK